jgi:hypoxanthine phosphoribosyltransferase
MISYGQFISHSGLMLPYKIICDSFSDEDWAGYAQIVRAKFAFSQVIGVPRGGLRFAEACKPFCVEGYPTLIVDDVLTTSNSMEEWRQTVLGPAIGVVIFARGPIPNWVWPWAVVQEWTQCRGTGTG